MNELIVRGKRIVTADGEFAGSVRVVDGLIAEIERSETPIDSGRPAEVVDVPEGCVLLPGLVDTHVHINDPGRTDWEGFASATAAAAAGGVTTLVDMPLNSIPPTIDVASLAIKRATASGQIAVDVAFWGGAVPENLDQLQPLHAAGVVGFKCFLLPSGVPEFGYLNRSQLIAAMHEIAAFGGLLIAHAEDPATIDAAPEPAGPSYAAFLASRPPQAEHRAIAMLLDATRETGCRTHIVHLSSAGALPQIATAKAEGLPLTVETCPHYLTLAAELVPAGATQFKCCPPIRDAANADALWQALQDGLIDCIVSDHSPSTIDLKRLDSGDFAAAWGGIASVQLGFPAIWTEASKRGYSLSQLIGWMSRGPAAITGLNANGTHNPLKGGTRKGELRVGFDADFFIADPAQDFVVNPLELLHRNPITPYAGTKLRGVVTQTWLRGALVERARPLGQLL